eukprot:gene12683-biopygen1932
MQTLSVKLAFPAGIGGPPPLLSPAGSQSGFCRAKKKRSATPYRFRAFRSQKPRGQAPSPDAYPMRCSPAMFTIHVRFKWHMSVSSGHVRSKWPLSVSSGPCPFQVAHVRFKWSMSVSSDPCPFQVVHVRFKWAMSVSSGPCPFQVALVHFEWPMSVSSGLLCFSLATVLLTTLR